MLEGNPRNPVPSGIVAIWEFCLGYRLHHSVLSGWRRLVLRGCRRFVLCGNVCGCEVRRRHRLARLCAYAGCRLLAMRAAVVVLDIGAHRRRRCDLRRSIAPDSRP